MAGKKLNPKDFTMFTKSSPWGYHALEVEDKIRQYEIALNKVNEKYIEAQQLVNEERSKIKKLQDELREMHLQMSSLELPDAEEAVENYVLNDFKNYNNPEHSAYPEPPIIKEDKSQIEANQQIINSNNLNDNTTKKMTLKFGKKNAENVENDENQNESGDLLDLLDGNVPSDGFSILN